MLRIQKILFLRRIDSLSILRLINKLHWGEYINEEKWTNMSTGQNVEIVGLKGFTCKFVCALEKKFDDLDLQSKSSCGFSPQILFFRKFIRLFLST